MSKREFLEKIKAGAIKGYESYSILPSISGAQSALESDWGRSDLAKEANNLFGIKASDDWNGDKKKFITKEQDGAGNETEIEAYFRVYDSWDKSIEDHGSFFSSTDWRKENYKHVFEASDYKDQAREIQNAGYATDVNYASKLIDIIEDHRLYNWDELVIKPRIRIIGGLG